MSTLRSETGRRGLLRRLCNEAGNVAIEFAFIAPLLLLLTAGIIEFIVVMYTIERGTDATRLGVREVLVNPSMVVLDNIDDTGTTSIACTFTFGSGTTVDSVDCGGNETADALTTAQEIVDVMVLDLPNLASGEVTVTYSWSDLDDPASVLLTPLVTVNLTGVTHEWVLLGGFVGLGTGMTLPSFTSSRVAHTQL